MSLPEPRIGYVLKMYPRFSETFILNEILALEEHGANLEIFSLRPPADGRFHEALAQVRAPVTYLPHHLKGRDLWQILGDGNRELPGLTASWGDLLTADADEAGAAVALAMAVRDHGITHLHAHFGSIATTVARLAAKVAGIGYSFTAHAKDIFHQDVDPDDLRRKLADARAVVTVSDFNLAFLRDHYGPDADGVVRLYNGLDLDQFGFNGSVLRPPVIAAVGRLVEKKGFDHLIDAIALLVARGRDISLELVGSGALEESLRARVARHGLQGHVRFHGPLPQGQVRDVVANAAVLAAPCVIGSDGNRDGLPTVLLEGLALGTPCVATPVTGIPEAVVHDETGLIVPEGDPLALADALAILLDHPEVGRRHAVAGRSLIEAEFDRRSNAGKLLDLFRQVSTGELAADPSHCSEVAA